MNSLITFTFLATVVIVVQTLPLDSGPQNFTEKSSVTQKLQKRYATKDVIVYLTPSQIKALQEGNGYINAQPFTQNEASEDIQEESEQPRTEEEEEIFQLRPIELDDQPLEGEDNQGPDFIPVEEQIAENLENDERFSWIYRPEENKFIPSPEDNYPYLQFYPESETQTEEETDLQENQDEEPQENEETSPKLDTPQAQKFRLVPYESFTEKSTTPKISAKEEPLKERWLRLLEQNRSQLRKAFPPTEKPKTKTTDEPPTKTENPLLKLRYSSKFNDQKQAIELEELRKKNQIKSQSALIQAESLANSHPILVRKEVTITKHQQPIIKHVTIKVPTPVLVPVPEPFEVKVPQPYPVPLEVLKRVPIAKTKKNEAKKPVSTENEKRTPTSFTKKSAPTETKKENPAEGNIRKPERLTIIRHIWEN